MKIAAALITLLGSATAFAPKALGPKTTAIKAYEERGLPGALPPTGFFDPFGFAEKADENTLKRYREAEVTHGRVAMLATVGFLVGERVAGTSFLFNGQIRGPAIDHLQQVPGPFWTLLVIFIANVELRRARIGWVEPTNEPVDRPGLLRENYYPGDIGFDPLNLKPTDPNEFNELQTKELQNGRLAMIGASGFIAQELVDGKGIIEHWQTNYGAP